MTPAAAIFPLSLLLAIQGVLLATLTVMIFFNLVYQMHKWRESGVRYGGVRWFLFRVKNHWSTHKAAIAMLVFLSGFWARIAVLWIAFMHSKYGTWSFGPTCMQMALVISTFISVIGGLCWVRVIAPVDVKRLTWMWIAIACIVIGALPSLF